VIRISSPIQDHFGVVLGHGLRVTGRKQGSPILVRGAWAVVVAHLPLLEISKERK